MDKKTTTERTAGGTGTVVLKKKDKRPNRQITSVNVQPSNSAVLAAVGAGMLPATMAMMIPMMLGRRKRSIDFQLPEDLLEELARKNDEFRKSF